MAPDRKTVTIEREVEGGSKHVIQMPTPCLIAVNKGINTPRYASLPGIMKAKKKEIKGWQLSDLGLSSSLAKTKESDFRLPPDRKAGKKIEGDPPTQVREVVRCLREVLPLLMYTS